MLFEEAIACYRSHRVLSSRDLVTLQHLAPHFSGRDIPDLRRTHIRQYIRFRQAAGVSISTVRRELRLPCAAINFTRDELEIIDLPNPFSRLKLSEPEGRVRWITRDEARRLVTAADVNAPRPHLACFIVLALNTGMRRGEMLNLEWSRVDFSRRIVLLEAKHTKSKRRRSVPLNDDALIALGRLSRWQSRYVPGHDFVFGWGLNRRITTFKTAWRTALRDAGIRDFRIHDLRHTCASWLVMQGETLQVVRDLLGHASITQTERYAHLAPNHVAAAVNRMQALQ